MTGKKETGIPWHHTTVVLRSDIYRQALERGIDISDVCNRALAGLTGSEYSPQQREDIPAPPPVIIAKNGSSLPAAGDADKTISRKMHPVINADDPAAPAKVVLAKARPAKKILPGLPAPEPVPVSDGETQPEAPAETTKKAAVPEHHTAPSKKKSRGDAVKTFFSQKVVRTDDKGDRVGKDELYALFARFCREHRITPVPERKAVTVALKNQCALSEELVDGIPFWTGVRLK